MPPASLRFQVIHGVLVVFALAVIARSAHVQLFEHDRWRARAARQQQKVSDLPAPRGDIEDAAGTDMAYSRDLIRIEVARNEVRNIKVLTRAMKEAGFPAAEVRRVADPARKYVTVRGTYEQSRVAEVTQLKGVKTFAVGDREYVQSASSRALLGSVAPSGRGSSGLELYLDTLLAGTRGIVRAVRAPNRVLESPDALTAPPQRGHDVQLTINSTLQNICDRSLASAVARLRADGGDVVVLNPRTGEVLCMAGRRPGKATGFGGATAVTEPYEPGSTLKPFFAARLIERGLARPEDVTETFNGRYEVAGRVINDTHKAARMTLSDVIRFSSNVGIVRFSDKLSNGDIYELLRDLGFGTPTGVPYPSEAAGVLREPRRWSGQSRASLAIGYEVSVTPLQLAAAYAPLANGGELVAPALIKEIRDREGVVVYRHQPQVIRRVFSTEAVRAVMPMLESVVDSGTATDAGLASFVLAGKSGTAKRTVGKSYGNATYTSTFVGLFPAGNPQYVVLAKVDNPRSESIYGGKVAAPIVKAVIEGAVSARDASLDWSALLPEKRPVQLVETVKDSPIVVAGAVEQEAAEGGVTLPTVPLVDSAADPAVLPPKVFSLAKPIKEAARPVRVVSVPDVRGLPLRVAVREIHRAGLVVRLVEGGGGGTVPAAGAAVRTGSVVRLTRP